MKVALNTTQKSNIYTTKQNNPNFTSRTPVFIFPEEKRLMPNWNGTRRRILNYICNVLNIATKEAPPNKDYQPTLWREIADFVSNGKLGQANTWVRGKKSLFHQIRAYTDESERKIAAKLEQLGLKFAQVGLE